MYRRFSCSRYSERKMARIVPVGYIYSYADRKAELTFAKSIIYVIL